MRCGDKVSHTWSIGTSIYLVLWFDRLHVFGKWLNNCWILSPIERWAESPKQKDYMRLYYTDCGLRITRSWWHLWHSICLINREKKYFSKIEKKSTTASLKNEYHNTRSVVQIISVGIVIIALIGLEGWWSLAPVTFLDFSSLLNRNSAIRATRFSTSPLFHKHWVDCIVEMLKH